MVISEGVALTPLAVRIRWKRMSVTTICLREGCGSIMLREFKLKMVECQVVTPTFGLVPHPTEKIWITLQKRLFWGINYSDVYN